MNVSHCAHYERSGGKIISVIYKKNYGDSASIILVLIRQNEKMDRKMERLNQSEYHFSLSNHFQSAIAYTKDIYKRWSTFIPTP